MEDFAIVFRERLSGQAEACARKTLEWLQKDLKSARKLAPEEVYYLASAAEILLTLRDTYGKK